MTLDLNNSESWAITLAFRVETPLGVVKEAILQAQLVSYGQCHRRERMRRCDCLRSFFLFEVG
jgi:hypothetical protein